MSRIEDRDLCGTANIVEVGVDCPFVREAEISLAQSVANVQARKLTSVDRARHH